MLTRRWTHGLVDGVPETGLLESISGKVSGGFAELELGNWKIGAGSSRRRNHPNTKWTSNSQGPPGWSLSTLPRQLRKALTLRARGLSHRGLGTSQQAGPP